MMAHVLGDGGHVRDEGALGVGLGRRGLPALHPASDRVQGVGAGIEPRGLPLGVLGLPVGLVVRALPEGGLEALVQHAAGLSHHLPLRHVEGTGGYLVGGWAHELHRVALADGAVDVPLVLGHLAHGHADLLRDDAVVGGYGLVIERLGADREVHLPVHAKVLHGLPQHGGCLVEVLGLEVLGVGAVVGDGLVLVAEVLGDLLGAVGGHAEAPRHVRDEHGQVVGQRRVL